MEPRPVAMAFKSGQRRMPLSECLAVEEFQAVGCCALRNPRLIPESSRIKCLGLRPRRSSRQTTIVSKRLRRASAIGLIHSPA